ncbi:hypothetical protein HS1genome_2157 [Sulfodiicoccus acidiphilus]|uniref:Uncharacterized protein n=1 Tax=Sulfodiicoccus acidiphilus TaxID=1670455 RepID=A0A348B6G6_9CREN|nr:hypothetical protein [Sulfodiicoccus acidiphilus]BBD73768.1 hypothetical protein HS1genome_2157 [Sulfodiicoccus acidiphilus]GGT98207.1 hypothetical protein GCM10007116_14730 [Sulfodiicoccus acidiphilus]
MTVDTEVWSKVLSQLEGINRTGLTMPESELLKYVEREWRTSMQLVERFNKDMGERRWFRAISAFLQLLQRANAAYSYLYQPTTVASLNNERVANIVNDVLGVLTDTVTRCVEEIKSSSKDMGVESVTLATSSFPPTLSVSVVVKNA